MANLSKTRAIFGWTSPRTIEKIIPEIELLIRLFEGKIWDKNLQADFFYKLSDSDFFEGQKKVKEPDFAARDRITRAPQMLGFIDLKPKIALTEAGLKLLTQKRIYETFAKQLFKFQLPSPYHKIPQERNFNVRPYLELLRLVKELGNISKKEIAIFFLQLTNYNNFEKIVHSIKKFREDISKHKGNRKIFIDKIFTKEIKKIYSGEIKSKNFKIRENTGSSIDKFIKTKKSNLIDYADAIMRYIRATRLVTFDKNTFRMIISKEHFDEVEYILKNIHREAFLFKNLAEFKKYLFNPSTLTLLSDKKEFIESKLKERKFIYDKNLSTDDLKDLLETLENEKISDIIKDTKIKLKNYDAFNEIIEIFNKIQDREIPDPSLYLEWNIWRAIEMINYAKKIKGNFRFDLDGMPLNTALGNMPDIEVEYDNFKMIVEVTMSLGSKQYEMEGEPVARHYGRAQNNSKYPVYCLFIAPKINDDSLIYFFNLNRIYSKTYGGKTRIIPISISQFISLITVAKERIFKDSKLLKNLFELIIQKNLVCIDEFEWSKFINDSVNNWVS